APSLRNGLIDQAPKKHPRHGVTVLALDHLQQLHDGIEKQVRLNAGATNAQRLPALLAREQHAIRHAGFTRAAPLLHEVVLVPERGRRVIAAPVVRQWVLANFASSWLLLAPLLAAYSPHQLFQTYFRLFLRRHSRRLLNVADPYQSMDVECPAVPRFSSLQLMSPTDNLYEEVKAYLRGMCSQDARELRAESAKHGDGLVISMHDGQDVADDFKGVTLWRHYRLVIDDYVPHVRRRGREILFSNRRRRLYTNNRSLDSYMSKPWSSINFDHPTTFDTLAMEQAKKKAIMDDLDAFRNEEEFHRQAGRPASHDRGHMANYLNYDIYNVELTTVSNNNDLRKLLMETTSKSIIIIEDIDCSLDLTGERARALPAPRNPYDLPASAVTLSGLLNFIDGIWSACGGERIIVFTTNHVEKLDPALIRRGRMDKHIEMSYCGFEAFKTLAKNYLDIDSHRLFGAVEELLLEVDIRPADVAECLTTARRGGNGEHDSSMEFLIE
ncbi:AAA-ATPase, partial [Dichanthelium oligosanthes]